jgi:hypothetical protein
VSLSFELFGLEVHGRSQADLKIHGRTFTILTIHGRSQVDLKTHGRTFTILTIHGRSYYGPQDSRQVVSQTSSFTNRPFTSLKTFTNNHGTQ